jgi:hypothetical protein
MNLPEPFNQFLEQKVPVKDGRVRGRRAQVTSLYLTKVVLHLTANGAREGKI